jgi:hypothetical protein
MDTTPPKGHNACKEALDRNGMLLPLSANVWFTEIKAMRMKKKSWTIFRIAMLLGRKICIFLPKRVIIEPPLVLIIHNGKFIKNILSRYVSFMKFM